MTKQSKKQKQKQYQQIQEQEENGNKENTDNGIIKSSGQSFQTDENFDENNLQVNLDFKRLNGDAYSMPYYQMLAHVFNHSTYHRGQIVTMLRQVGFTDVGSTDMLGFFR